MNSIITIAARAAHEVNRAYCLAHGDTSQVSWDDAPDWQKTSAENGVRGVIAGNDPAKSHAGWLLEKIANGWKYGPTKDPDKKEHPCMVPYEELPHFQKKKDHLFVSTVRTVLDALMPTYKIVQIHHADHGISHALLSWAIGTIAPTGFFLDTLPIPEGHADLTSNLYGPIAGDPPVQGEMMIRDANDAFRQSTPFVDLPPRPTRLLTVIGVSDENGNVTVFTAYGGHAAERIPSDPSLENDAEGRARAEAFWKVHALSIAAKK